MPSITSKDGTVIAYDKVGNGPAIILVNGALGHRGLNGEQQLASLLASNFTVFFYDRRGRGESSETKPYSVEGEIADIEALINEYRDALADEYRRAHVGAAPACRS